MRNTILATVVALGLSAVAFGANNPSTPAPAASNASTSQTATNAKPVDPKLADCQKQAKEKGLKGAEHKKFIAECVKKKDLRDLPREPALEAAALAAPRGPFHCRP